MGYVDIDGWVNRDWLVLFKNNGLPKLIKTGGCYLSAVKSFT